MKTWQKTLVIVASVLVALILVFVMMEYTYVARFIQNKKELTFNVDAQTEQGQLKVMSANIRCDTLFDFGKRTWQYRADLITKNILQVKPTIIGMQEATPQQYEYYKDILTDYESEIVYRDNTSVREGCPIFYRKDLYTLINKGSFWLSETPDVMSIDWDSACYRICSYVILCDNATSKQFVVFNTHLDHVSNEARIKGIGVVLDKIKAFGGYPAILMGDFNAKENSATYKAATKNFDDVKYKVQNDFVGHCTYQNWGEELDYPTIDFFMISKTGFAVDSYEVITTLYDGVYPSDHFPIVTKLTLER